MMGMMGIMGIMGMMGWSYSFMSSAVRTSL